MAEHGEQSRIANLARATVNCRCHVCAFFDSRDDAYSVMPPFMKEGIDAGDRAGYILDKHKRAERLRLLDDTGLDSGGIEQSGQLEARPWENAYFGNGRFDQDSMIAPIEDVGKTGSQRDTGITRLSANMEWALTDFPGVHDIVEYESRLTRVPPNYDMITGCGYDLAQFSASVVMDILR